MGVNRIILLLGLIGVAENQADLYNDGVASICEKWKWVFVLSPGANEINRLIELVESARSAIVKKPKNDNDDVYVSVSPEDFHRFRQKSQLLKVYKSHSKKCIVTKTPVSSNVVTSTSTSRSTKKWTKSKPTSVVQKSTFVPARLASKSPSTNTSREIIDKTCKCTKMLKNESKEKLANDSWSNLLENFTKTNIGRNEQVKNISTSDKNARSNNSSKQNWKKKESVAIRRTKKRKDKDRLKESQSEHRRSSKESRRMKREDGHYAKGDISSDKSSRCLVIRITAHCGDDYDETNEDHVPTPMLDASADEPVDTYLSTLPAWQPSVADEQDDSLDTLFPVESTVPEKPVDSFDDLFLGHPDDSSIETPQTFQENPDDDNYDDFLFNESDPMDELFFSEIYEPLFEPPEYSPDHASGSDETSELKDYHDFPSALIANDDNDSLPSEHPTKDDTSGEMAKSFWPLGTHKFSEKSDGSRTEKSSSVTSDQIFATGKSVPSDIHGTINKTVNDVNNVAVLELSPYDLEELDFIEDMYTHENDTNSSPYNFTDDEFMINSSIDEPNDPEELDFIEHMYKYQNDTNSSPSNFTDDEFMIHSPIDEPNDPEDFDFFEHMYKYQNDTNSSPYNFTDDEFMMNSSIPSTPRDSPKFEEATNSFWDNEDSYENEDYEEDNYNDEDEKYTDDDNWADDD